MSCNRFGLPSLTNLLLIVFLTQILVYSASASKRKSYPQLLGSNLLKSLALEKIKSKTAYPLTADLSALLKPKTDCSSYPCCYKKAKKNKCEQNAAYLVYALLKALTSLKKPECPTPAPVTAPCVSPTETTKYVPYYVPVPYYCTPSPPPATPPPVPPPPPSPPPPPPLPKIKLSIIESPSPLLPEVETCSCLINPEDLCATKKMGKQKMVLKDKKELLAELLPVIEILKEKILKPKKPKCYCLCFADNDKCPPGMVSSKSVCLDKIMQTVELVKKDKKKKKIKDKKDKKKKKLKKLKKKRMTEIDECEDEY